MPLIANLPKGTEGLAASFSSEGRKPFVLKARSQKDLPKGRQREELPLAWAGHEDSAANEVCSFFWPRLSLRFLKHSFLRREHSTSQSPKAPLVGSCCLHSAYVQELAAGLD